MAVQSLDHVNIITPRLEETAAFYSDLLALDRRDPPHPLTPQQALWMHDERGHPVLHLNATDCSRRFDRAFTSAAPAGAIHHVALACSGYDETIARVEAMGLEYQTGHLASIGLRQVFVFDPNGVLLELNFHAS